MFKIFKMTTPVILAIAAMAATTSPAAAGTTVHRSNVPTCEGKSVNGFMTIGAGRTFYVEAKYANECFNSAVTVLPEGMSVFDEDAVAGYLNDPTQENTYAGFEREKNENPLPTLETQDPPPTLVTQDPPPTLVTQDPLPDPYDPYDPYDSCYPDCK